MTEAAQSVDTDILIVGAGPVGMTLALALQAGNADLRTALLDARPRGAFVDDPRALALSHGTRQLLETLDAWNAPAATPIHDIHVSQSGGFGRTIIDRNEQGVPALGYVMRYKNLCAGLDGHLAESAILERTTLTGTRLARDHIVATVRQGDTERTIRTRLLVHADGTPRNSPDVFVADYRQHAVLAEVRSQPLHGNRAWERFTPDGPLALLPLGDDYSVVFTVPPAQADALMQMDDATFLAALQAQFGSRLHFTATSPRARFPLALRLRRQLHAEREVWIGNAAQTLHPVSGQGFNLGIRDAWELAETLLDTWNTDNSGATERLAAYAARRRLDRAGSAAFTDAIVRTFSNNLPLLQFARGAGLMALDLLPFGRRFIASRMIWGARALP